MSEFLSWITDPDERRKLASSTLDVLNRGLVANTLGAPVDMANSLVNLGKAAVGYVGHKAGLLDASQMPDVDETPVGGSEWIAQQMQQRGLLGSYRNPVAETVATGLLAPAGQAALQARAPQIAARVSALGSKNVLQKTASSDKINASVGTGRLDDPRPATNQRSFSDDYPQGIELPDGSPLPRDIEGRPLTAPFVVGRRVVGGADVPLRSDEIVQVAQDLGAKPLPATKFQNKDLGRFVKTHDSDGNTVRTIQLDSSVNSRAAPHVFNHEVGHLIDDLTFGGAIPGDGVKSQLKANYNAINNPRNDLKKPVTPETFGYKNPEDISAEYMAEAIRSYMRDPGSFKANYPELAARIRGSVNANQNINKVIQFNQAVPATVGAGLLGYSLLSPTDD